jgi:hypothetical protein
VACFFVRPLAIAKETKCRNDADCELLDEMRIALGDQRPEGFTPKNMALIRQVLTPGVWDRIVTLPFVMMEEARKQRQHAPLRAAVSAQIAVAIAILCLVPLRIKNLTEIRLGLRATARRPGARKNGPCRIFSIMQSNYTLPKVDLC